MITSFDLSQGEINQIDRELKQKIGIEVEHTPYLTEEFSNLLMETESRA